MKVSYLTQNWTFSGYNGAFYQCGTRRFVVFYWLFFCIRAIFL